MSDYGCCALSSASQANLPATKKDSPFHTWARRVFGGARWLVPTGVVVVLPKCPACLAAYVALATGVGVSFHTAIYLRFAIVALCLLSLAYLAATRGVGLLVHAPAIRRSRRRLSAM